MNYNTFPKEYQTQNHALINTMNSGQRFTSHSRQNKNKNALIKTYPVIINNLAISIIEVIT